MNDKYEEFIRPNLVLLCENIDATDSIRHLADILTRTDFEQIKCDQNRKGKTRAAWTLLDRLRRRENWFERLLEVLCVTGLEHIAKIIKPGRSPPRMDQAPGSQQSSVEASSRQTTFNNCNMSNVLVGDHGTLNVNHAPPPSQSCDSRHSDNFRSFPGSRGSDERGVIIERRSNDTPSLSNLPIDSLLGFDHPQGSVCGGGRNIREHSSLREDTLGTMERNVQHTTPKTRSPCGDPPPYTECAQPGESLIEAGARQPFSEEFPEAASSIRPPTDILPEMPANGLSQAPVRSPGYCQSLIDERSRSMNPTRFESTGNGNDPERTSMDSEYSSSDGGITRLKRFQPSQQSINSDRPEEPMNNDSDNESFHPYPLRDTQEPAKRHPDQNLLVEAAEQLRQEPEFGTARPDPTLSNLNITTQAEQPSGDTQTARNIRSVTARPVSEQNNCNMNTLASSTSENAFNRRDNRPLARPMPDLISRHTSTTTTALPPSDYVTIHRPSSTSNPRVPFVLPHVDPLMTNFDLTMDSNITAAQRAARNEAERLAAEEECRSCTGSCESSMMGEVAADSNPVGHAQVQGAHGGDGGVGLGDSSRVKRQSQASPGVVTRTDLSPTARSQSQSASPPTTNQKGTFSNRSRSSVTTGRSENPVLSGARRDEVLDSESVELAPSLYDIATNDATVVSNTLRSTIQSQFKTSVPNRSGTDQQSEFTTSLPHNSVVPSPIQPAQNLTTEVPDFGQLGSFSLSVHESANEPSLQGVPMSPKGDGNISRAVIGPNEQNGGDDGASHVTGSRVVNDANQQTENIEHDSNELQVDNQTTPLSSEVILTQRESENATGHTNELNETGVNNEQVEDMSTVSNRLLIISTFVVFGALAVGMVYRYSRQG